MHRTLFKVYSNLSQPSYEIAYNLRSHSDFVIPKVKTVYKGLSYFGPIIWNLISTEVKHRDSIANFSKKIRKGNLIVVLVEKIMQTIHT